MSKTENIEKEEVKEEKKIEPSQVEELYKFASEKVENLIVSEDNSNQIFAKIHNHDHIETVNLDSVNAVNWLMYEHRTFTKAFYGMENYKTAMKHLKSEALFNGTAREKIYVRIAQTKNGIYYDLGGKTWNLVKIFPTGQNLIIPYSKTTPTFDRTRGIVEQKAPAVRKNKKYSNPLDDLCTLLKIKISDKILFKVHLIHFFLQNQETPIMIITGEHGSIKTTITQSVKKIVDPSSSNSGSLPIDKKELQIDISNKYLSAYDNVSGFKRDVSDILCRAITGDEIAKRALYTDNDLFVRAYDKKKIVLNGISPNIEYPDFNDRSVYYETSYLPDSEKISKSDYWEKFDELLPYVLDQIFRVLSKMLVTYDEIGNKITPKTRMADFEKYGETISQVLGYDPKKFLEIYFERHGEIEIKDYDRWPIITIIEDRMQDLDHLQELTSDFYKTATLRADVLNIDIKDKYANWPKQAHFLTIQLKKLKPTLRTIGYEVDIQTYPKRDKPNWHNKSVITIHRHSKQALPALPALPKEEQEHKNPEQNENGRAGLSGRADSETSHTSFTCLTCNAGPFSIDEKSRSSGSILELHSKQGHSIQYFNQKEVKE